MKKLVLFLLFSSVAHADYCKVESKPYPELEQGINKDSICREALFAISGSYQPVPGAKLKVQANDQRGMYWVILNQIEYSVDGEIVYQGLGRLVWHPDAEYVVLN